MIQCLLLAPLLLLAAAVPAGAIALTPTRDDQVIETLPSRPASRADERRLRQAVQADPGDAGSAVRLAQRLVDQARESGDPRLAGQALAALQAWNDPDRAPLEVLLMQATLQQYLHDFDGAATLLERLLVRDPQQGQAWLTLATVRRVQGRYADADRACERLLAVGAALYGSACLAENAALRGDFDSARRRLQQLAVTPRLDGGTRNWLLTSLAELEQRALNAAAAEAAFKAALAARADGYSLIAYADFLIDQGRPADALALLRGQPRSDGVLLRLAIAGVRARTAQAADDAREMRERIAQANLRPQAQGVHAREQAMFALRVDADAPRALALAQANVRVQREPIDMIVLAQAAAAARQPAAQREAARLAAEMGLHDRRLDALL